MRRKHRDVRALYEQRRAALGRFNEWEAHHRPTPTLDTVFDSIGTLRDMLPVDVRSRDHDPEKSGIALMRERLRVVRPHSRD